MLEATRTLEPTLETTTSNIMALATASVVGHVQSVEGGAAWRQDLVTGMANYIHASQAGDRLLRYSSSLKQLISNGWRVSGSFPYNVFYIRFCRRCLDETMIL